MKGLHLPGQKRLHGSRQNRAPAVPVVSQSGAPLVIAIGGEDDEQRGVLDDREPRIVVGLELRDEVAEDVVPLLEESRPNALLEELDEAP